ncbi:response regulator transcription factor [Acidovorax sp. Root217]|uniref:response regulator transcription factor n=1 Tax=unclassified Acidovorax TaxID=2684926 RepID=UPI000711166D|nr:response regulator transcription factor [Acidovorax sp. Root217]KRC23503.1 LuxR family transcriptional regulator [Acidovorax sp. Root217]
MPQLLLVDDHPLFCVGFAHALAHAWPGARVDTACTLEEGLRAAAGQPGLDIVLLDQRLGAHTGLQGLALFARQFPLVARVLISGDEDPALQAAARGAGASGFLGKSQSVQAMAAALGTVAAGGMAFDTQPAAVPGDLPSDLAGPTARQMEVLLLVAQGQPNKRIAQALGIAERTVKLHVTALLGALQARNRTHLVVAAREKGLL